MIEIVFLLFFALCKSGSSFEISIVHMNDVHSYFHESTPDNLRCSDRDKELDRCFGGLARQVTKIKEIRAQEKNVLVLSSGDFYMAESYHPYHGWKLASVLLPFLTLNATSFGNHDFDRNMMETAAYVIMLDCPVVATNLIGRAGSFWEKYVNKSIILDVDGQKIGIVGYIDPDTKHTARTGVSLNFTDEIPSLTEEVAKLKSSGVNKIIALGHSDYHTDREIAEQVPDIDIIVGGNSEIYPNTVSDAAANFTGSYPTVVTRHNRTEDRPADVAVLVQVPQHGRYLGHIKVEFDDAGHIVNYSGSPILLSKNILPDTETETEVEKSYAAMLRRSYFGHLPPYDEILIELPTALNGSVCRMQECPLGNLITDAMAHGYLHHEDDLKKRKVAGAVWNAGCIRSSLKAGNVTFLDLTFALYLGDFAVIRRMNGSDLMKMMEHSVAKYDISGIAPPGSFLQVSRMKVEYDLTKPVGQRVASLNVFCSNCRKQAFYPVKTSQTYNIVMPQYFLQGGDGFFQAGGNRLNAGDITDGVAIASYLKQKLPNSDVEGRIKFWLPNFEKSSNLSALTQELYRQTFRNDQKNIPFFEYDKGREESHLDFKKPMFNSNSQHDAAMMSSLSKEAKNDTKASSPWTVLNHTESQNLTASTVSPNGNSSVSVTAVSSPWTVLNPSESQSVTASTVSPNGNSSVSVTAAIRKDAKITKVSSVSASSSTVKTIMSREHPKSTTGVSSISETSSTKPGMVTTTAANSKSSTPVTTSVSKKEDSRTVKPDELKKTRKDLNDKTIEAYLIEIFKDEKLNASITNSTENVHQTSENKPESQIVSTNKSSESITGAISNLDVTTNGQNRKTGRSETKTITPDLDGDEKNISIQNKSLISDRSNHKNITFFHMNEYGKINSYFKSNESEFIPTSVKFPLFSTISEDLENNISSADLTHENSTVHASYSSTESELSISKTKNDFTNASEGFGSVSNSEHFSQISEDSAPKSESKLIKVSLERDKDLIAIMQNLLPTNASKVQASLPTNVSETQNILTTNSSMVPKSLPTNVSQVLDIFPKNISGIPNIFPTNTSKVPKIVPTNVSTVPNIFPTNISEVRRSISTNIYDPQGNSNKSSEISDHLLPNRKQDTHMNETLKNIGTENVSDKRATSDGEIEMDSWKEKIIPGSHKTIKKDLSSKEMALRYNQLKQNISGHMENSSEHLQNSSSHGQNHTVANLTLNIVTESHDGKKETSSTSTMSRDEGKSSADQVRHGTKRKLQSSPEYHFDFWEFLRSLT